MNSITVKFNDHVELFANNAVIEAEETYDKWYRTFIVLNGYENGDNIHAEVSRDYFGSETMGWEACSSSTLRVNEEIITLGKFEKYNKLSIYKSDVGENFTNLTVLKINYGEEKVFNNIKYFIEEKENYKTFDIQYGYTDNCRLYKHDFHAYVETAKEQYEILIGKYKYGVTFAADAAYVSINSVSICGMPIPTNGYGAVQNVSDVSDGTKVGWKPVRPVVF